MKKLLLILSVFTISASSAATLVSCNYIDTQKLSVKNKVNNLMRSTSHFFKPAALAYSEKFNIKDMRSEIRNKPISELDNSNDNTKVNDLFNLFFEKEDMQDFYDVLKTNPDFDYESKTNPVGAQIKTISNLIKTIQQNIRGLNPGLIIDNVISSNDIARQIVARDKEINKINETLNKIGQSTEKVEDIKNQIEKFSKTFDNLNSTIQKSKDDVSKYFKFANELKAHSIEDLKIFYNGHKTNFNVDNIRYWSLANLAFFLADATDYEKEGGGKVPLADYANPEGFSKHFSNIVDSLINEKSKFEWNDDILKYAINFIMGLSWYVSYFNDFNNEAPADDNHLFSKEKSNWTIFEEVKTTKINNVSELDKLDSNWDTILKVFLDLIDPSKNDDKSYQNTKVLKILFQTEDQVDNFDFEKTVGMKFGFLIPGGLGIHWKGTWAIKINQNGLIPVLGAIIPIILKKVIPTKIKGIPIHGLIHIKDMSTTITNLLASILANNNSSFFFKGLESKVGDILDQIKLIWEPSDIIKQKINTTLDKLAELTNRPVDLLMHGNLIGQIVELITKQKVIINLADVINFKIPMLNIKIGDAIKYLLTGTIDNFDKVYEGIANVSKILNDFIKNIESSMGNIQTAFSAFSEKSKFTKENVEGSEAKWKIYNAQGVRVSYETYFQKAGMSNWMSEDNPPNDFVIATSMFQNDIKSYTVMTEVKGKLTELPIKKLAYELLGYDSDNKVGIKDGMLWKIQRIWTGESGKFLDLFFDTLETVFNNAVKLIPGDPDKEKYMNYMNDNNFEYKLNNYENFVSVDKNSKIEYTVTYTDSKFNKQSFLVKIELLASENEGEYSKYKINEFTALS